MRSICKNEYAAQNVTRKVTHGFGLQPLQDDVRCALSEIILIQINYSRTNSNFLLYLID